MQSAASSASAGIRGRNDSGDLREKLKGLTTKQVLLASRGPTMEEAIEMNAERQRELAEVQPREVLRQLQEGNSRFWMGLAQRPEMSAMERRALIMQQSPRVAILGCSDSRVPIEIVFDQGLGECFAVRVAGNVYSAATAASLDYAVAHLKVKLVSGGQRREGERNAQSAPEGIPRLAADPGGEGGSHWRGRSGRAVRLGEPGPESDKAQSKGRDAFGLVHLQRRASALENPTANGALTQIHKRFTPVS